ncbi:hypothetical protein RAS1_17250 [Phycisphaerae bacterium RAS1]|nr:hypothetical protein RAS1_17250 [Phycisphaerae bacterium RAS1]
MLPEEKQQLLDLLSQEQKWCQHAEAHDAAGDPVQCDDRQAAAWDLTGAVYRLFGCRRAGALYLQIDRHLHGKRRSVGWPPPDLELLAMTSLQAFNDRAETTFALLRARLEDMPVWAGERRSSGEIPPETAG